MFVPVNFLLKKPFLWDLTGTAHCSYCLDHIQVEIDNTFDCGQYASFFLFIGYVKLPYVIMELYLAVQAWLNT